MSKSHHSQRKEQLRFVSASRFSWFCCDFDVPCDCRQGSAACCQCEEASYASFCDAGTPRDCSAPPLKVSRLKAFSRVRTAVSMAACGCPVCEKHQTLYQRDRPGWLGKLMLCSFTNQVLVPDLLEGKHGLQKRSSLLARELNEIAAYLHLPALGTEHTVFYPGSSLLSPNASDTWKYCSSHVSQVGGQQIPREGPT